MPRIPVIPREEQDTSSNNVFIKIQRNCKVRTDYGSATVFF